MKQCMILCAVLLLVVVQVPDLEAETAQPISSLRSKTMSLEKEKSLSRRALEMWASENSDKPEDIFAENYINHQEPDAKGGVKSIGLEGWKELVRANHRAFSNFQVRILMQIAEGSLVATRWQFQAKHTGVYLGHPPTGQQAIWTGVQIDRFENGKIIESWVDWDKYRLFEELGFVKKP